MGKKLGRIQRKSVEVFLDLMKRLPYERVPKEVLDELAKFGLVKEENENMTDFSNKILAYLKEKEGTI
jgi:hypothetical protein